MASGPKKLLSNSNRNYTKEKIIERECQEAQLNKFSKIDTEPPHFLGEIAKQEYLRVLPHMQESPISNLDKAQLTQYCSFYSDFVETSLILEREDLTLEDDEGDQKVNPTFNMKEKAGIRLQQAANTLGLTIGDRLHIMVSDEKEDDDPYMELVSD